MMIGALAERHARRLQDEGHDEAAVRRELERVLESTEELVEAECRRALRRTD